ncbi:MFS transporter [Kaistia dalseonensis]|uniref:EmrB/QacA subfamily drug resistance transporter n=1 Tax=Kaistia dalseonensis TaxID=410840 RepID=A0ABU0H2E4_9HYPH|nr:MFS transporter [Kaistia dalseonensis]MCX5493891.1 MFS transporter [Kaistia dalseonensis]MDQ0436457.1 EmrB/QacA subfamily drug resistance transporter [Kaistia dalseonensis]
MPSDISLGASAGSHTPSFRFTALIVASALFMEQLDSTVLATALPTMSRSFGVSPLDMSIALTGYLLSLAVFIPASGWFADRFGARNVFCTAIATFMVGSLLCAQAPTLTFLVLARILQGMGGAMMVPVARLIILKTVPRADFVNAMAWLLVPALIGPILGPMVGGLIVTYLDWRWIFYVNIPLGIVGIALASQFIVNAREEKTEPFDFAGLVLSGVSLGSLMFAFETSGRGEASPAVAASLFGAGIISGALYIRHARRHAAPILDLSLMRIQTFRLSVIGGGFARISAGAMPFLLPMMMQLGFGFSALHSGLVTFIAAVGSMAMKAAATPILRRFGFRNTLIWNSIIASGFLALYAAFRPEWPLFLIYALLLVGGFFQSLQFTAYNTIAYADVERRRMSAATSFYTTLQQMMLSLGICVSAGALHASIMIEGRTSATLADFSVAFLTVTSISILAAIVCLRFPKGAGDDMAGRTAAPAETGH